MNKTKKIQAITLSAALAAMVFAGGAAVYADEVAGRGNPMSGLVAAIASKFNLSESDVQAVFDEQMQVQREKTQANREEAEAKRQEQFESRLNKLLSEGKLTQAQVTAIKAKKAELETAREANKDENRTEFKNMTEEERKAAMEEQKTKMEAEREALKQWAQDNGISEEYLPMVGMGFAGGGHGRGGGFGAPGDGRRPCADGGSATQSN